jgi:hypothetical protein
VISRLPKRNSFRTRRQGPPEVWFRILHVAPDGHNGVTEAELLEQTVEIALGPKGAFENGNVGAVTRRVAAERVVSAVPRPRRPPKLPRQPRIPRVVELLRKAIEWRRQLDAGEIQSQAAIARHEGITRARVTQVMGMLRLAPEIRQRILAMPIAVRRRSITERALRPIAQVENYQEQLSVFEELLAL